MIEFILECMALIVKVCFGLTCWFIIFFIGLMILSFIAKGYYHYKQAGEKK